MLVALLTIATPLSVAASAANAAVPLDRSNVATVNQLDEGPGGSAYVAYTLDTLNNVLYPQDPQLDSCNGQRAAPYIIHEPDGPLGVLALPGTGELFVSCSSNNVLVVNSTTGGILANIPVGRYPGALTKGNQIWVANFYSDNLSVISSATNRVVASVPLPAGARPTGVVKNFGNGDIYVTESGNSTVAVLSDTTHREIAAIPVGSKPYGIA
ncbi:PE_PGRS family protein, partial [mine drainage metagenome]